MTEEIDQDTSNMVFDPDQDLATKCALRRSYRALYKPLEGAQGDPSAQSIDGIMGSITRANELFEQVRGPQEATLDSNLFLMASNIGAQKARAMKSSSGAFDVDDFIHKLVSFMRPDQPINEAASNNGGVDAPLQWDKVGRLALATSRRVPSMDFMLGPLSVEQKKRATVKRAKLEKKPEDRTQPQELKEEDISRSPNETTKNVAILEELLTSDPEPINLFRFFINPNDFAQSVENLFYLSFLVRDGRVAFEIQDGNPVIYPCEPPTDDDRLEDGLKKRQLVMEFDMATWRHAIDVFNITESRIPQRPSARTRLGDQW
ncbi:hypothetical protein ONZ45_g9501 [Pleurotus djamor]|nr:hypothetical protein ONZ45_g9501 [Pleurotus djamor]